MELTSDQIANPGTIPGNQEIEWKYEMRRESQQIVPGVLLGPFQVSKDKQKLRDLGITHILCIRDVKEAFSVKPRFPEEFVYLVLDVQDTEDQNLIRIFPQAKGFIDCALAQNGTVLVHCNGGISLGPSFVIMFVMQHLKISSEDALHLVQNRRYCISPNGGFLTQIKEYEPIYRAIQEAQRFGFSSNVSTARRKRADDDSDDDDEDVESRRREAPVPRNLNAQAAQAAVPPQPGMDMTS